MVPPRLVVVKVQGVGRGWEEESGAWHNHVASATVRPVWVPLPSACAWLEHIPAATCCVCAHPPSASRADLESVLVLDPTHSDALRNLAEAEKGQGLLGEAQSHFNQLLAEHQDMVRARRLQVRRTFPPPPIPALVRFALLVQVCLFRPGRCSGHRCRVSP
jgi:hypothetical protein